MLFEDLRRCATTGGKGEILSRADHSDWTSDAYPAIPSEIRLEILRFRSQECSDTAHRIRDAGQAGSSTQINASSNRVLYQRLWVGNRITAKALDASTKQADVCLVSFGWAKSGAFPPPEDPCSTRNRHDTTPRIGKTHPKGQGIHKISSRDPFPPFSSSINAHSVR